MRLRDVIAGGLEVIDPDLADVAHSFHGSVLGRIEQAKRVASKAKTAAEIKRVIDRRDEVPSKAAFAYELGKIFFKR